MSGVFVEVRTLHTNSLSVNRASHGLEALDQCILLLCTGMTVVDKVYLYLTCGT
jgi:hypothetical protein